MNDIIQFDNNTKIADKNDMDVYLAEEYINSKDDNPYLMFPRAEYPLYFYQTRDLLNDMDRYRSFIENCVRRFRKSRAYKGYKSYLMSLGMDRSQILGNIQEGMASIEMHHNFLTIFDITILISQHILNTVGFCSSFDIIALLIQEHKNNNIPIVMLDKTSHQLYHDNPDFYIPISMTFGQWWNLLIKYRFGITLDIAYKVINYIKNCQRNNELNTLEFYKLENTIQSWGEYNDYYISSTNSSSWSNNYNYNFGGYIDSNVS